jgi:hypothetical protein
MNVQVHHSVNHCVLIRIGTVSKYNSQIMHHCFTPIRFSIPELADRVVVTVNSEALRGGFI